MSNHHEQATLLCPLCEEKMKDGHPVLQEWWRMVKCTFPDVHTSWVWRGQADQNMFYKEGKSRALWPSSKHNATLDGEPCSRAMDLFFIRPDGVPSWDLQKLELVSDVIIGQKKAPLVWGGSWLKFKDHPHFQLQESITQNHYSIPTSKHDAS